MKPDPTKAEINSIRAEASTLAMRLVVLARDNPTHPARDAIVKAGQLMLEASKSLLIE